MHRILVTGAGSWVGGRLVQRLERLEDTAVFPVDVVELGSHGIRRGRGKAYEEPRHRELPGGDAPVEQVPAPGFLERRQSPNQLVRVETRDQRQRTDAPALVIEPQGRLARNQAQAVALEMRLRMRHAGRVVPHVAEVIQACAQAGGGLV